MRRRFKNMLSFIAFLLFLAVLLGIFYFIYGKYISNPSEIKISGVLSINYLDGTKLKIDKDGSARISVINDSTEDAYYYIEFKNLKNIKGNIEYSISNNDDINVKNKLNNYNTIVSSYLLIQAGEIENFEISFNSEEDIKYSLEINVSIENLETDNFAEVILKNNQVKNTPFTIVGKEVAKTDEGLIKATDDFGTTYYFRGATANNNVLINGLNFKIVRINGDGTVKLILDGQVDPNKSYYSNIEEYEFAKTKLYSTLNDWVDSELGDYAIFIATQKYCNDNSVGADGLLALDRLKTDNIPSFVCLGQMVASKAALLTADEAIFAGATLDADNQDYYLYNSTLTSSYYLMTGASLTSKSYYPFVVNKTGRLITNTTGNYLRAIRPVISIIKTAGVTGDGSVNNPYILTVGE